ncbi:hypothetical protein [Oceanobacillus iheyensis HTE831]|uniref:Uncharacterized protein n=1 Tax=Oceanobacillus iheyensis (strain DSM 14371 / CIP 107618 / JCM 11309 / KCTC 3954 / HTE831) TaxID=221109 RepID=Q8EMQ4_OCEIH|nr:hypothetical protein [Oceanobacillus iheyensis]BAC14743.1 hypothetical protein [Oceanobacillus iheyensis HTE831]
MTGLLSNKYIKYGLIILLSVGLIMFTQEIKHVKDPNSMPVTGMTVLGLGVLWLFSMIGIFISDLVNKTSISILREFPVLGWVSIVSLLMCLLSDFFIQAIQAVDFLSITTPILTFAGISVANRLVDLKNTSWRVAIVAVFVFTGTYIGSALIATLGLYLAGN